jgi:hypothetical protein
MEVALRRRLDGVADVSISQSQQTAVVRFVPATLVFSAAAFRAAVGEADVEVLTLNADVCGVIDENHTLRASPAADAPLVLLRGRNIPQGDACVSGQLNDHAQPYELDVTTVRRSR